MDSLSTRVSASNRGGPSGEIVVRKALAQGLLGFGVSSVVADTESKFTEHMKHAGEYCMIILDLWTWAARGGKAKPFLKPHMKKVFLLDFFGNASTSATVFGNSRILTAYPTARFSFLGWFVKEAPRRKKLRQGVIWGKQASYFKDRWPVVLALARLSSIHLTIKREKGMPEHENITWHGTLNSDQWFRLLAESKYFAGLGNPLAGPSAIDAIAAGCVYFDPTFKEPPLPTYTSQNPFLSSRVGAPHVCVVQMGSRSEYERCALAALTGSVQPLIVADYTEKEHSERISKIFAGFLPSEVEGQQSLPPDEPPPPPLPPMSPELVKWVTQLQQKRACLTKGQARIFLYHTRKAAGTTLREYLQPVGRRWKAALDESEGLTLDARFLADTESLSVTTLRHPVDRVLSLYWYEHVGWWDGIKHDPANLKPFSEWLGNWQDGSSWKTSFMQENPGSVYVEVQNYFVKSLSGWQGPGAVNESDLATAKARLREFDMVLLTERMDEQDHAHALSTVFDRPVQRKGHALKANKSAKLRLRDKLAPDEAADRRTLEELNRLDLELWEFAQELVQVRLAHLDRLDLDPELPPGHCKQQQHTRPPDLSKMLGIHRPVGHKM